MSQKGQSVGYIRVSTVDQNVARQLDGIVLDKVFTDQASGKNTDRPQLAAVLTYVREGDTLHVHSLDRLARNLVDLRRIVSDLTARGVRVHFEKEGLIFGDDDSPMSTLLLNIMGAFAEFERSLILERQREGIAQAKKRGVYRGRQPSLTDNQVAELQDMLQRNINKTQIARHFRIGRTTLYRYINPNHIDKQSTIV